ncbi:hypothetical protein GYMLUDRAFT_679884 [Collybiopsis luxurians FD-317 M1]|uniref:Uncharacterized protein n=1 Tax=Collybiopsis luxurians FD-317 M1 TaxID=944289 RepID=A0A0D0CKR8_9AGAR|nr:hypothetical protein GYMLUDRAFT_679884 [Collybiopsis luxurians FD-317 M1]
MGHTICVFHAVYFYAVTHYGEKEVLLRSIPHSWPAAVFFHGLVAILGKRPRRHSLSVLDSHSAQLRATLRTGSRALALAIGT